VAAITTTTRVASDVFAPGHLGELTQIVPFEMVDAALAATGAAERRVRQLPARVVVYLLLAGCLFAELGYRQVWHKLTVGLGGLPVADPSEGALWQARARLGVTPLRWLFDLLRGPAAAAGAGRRAPGAGRRGALVRAAGVRHRRHHHEHPRQRQKPGGIHQAGRQPRRVRVPVAADGGPGGLRHPHDHRRGLRPDQHR
jgi:hypothetical protein